MTSLQRQNQRQLGDALRRLRSKYAQCSQEVFAARIGMHRTYYSAIERGEKNCTLETLLTIRDELNLKLSVIFQEAKL